MNPMLNRVFPDDVYIGEVPDIRIKGWMIKVWYRPSDHSVIYQDNENFQTYMSHGMMCSNLKCGVGMRRLICKYLGIEDGEFCRLDKERLDTSSEDFQSVRVFEDNEEGGREEES
jgi:hypothetical protein